MGLIVFVCPMFKVAEITVFSMNSGVHEWTPTYASMKTCMHIFPETFSFAYSGAFCYFLLSVRPEPLILRYTHVFDYVVKLTKLIFLLYSSPSHISTFVYVQRTNPIYIIYLYRVSEKNIYTN